MILGRYVRAGLILLAPMALGVFVWFVNPSAAGWLPDCPFHLITGLHCPGCGSTRAMHQLVHGHLGAALALNPLAVALTPVMAWFLVCEFHETLGRPLRHPRASHKWAWVLVAAIVGFGVLRNVPVYPLTMLAPH